ncbi:MAG TPA: AAA family ATPase [Polyangiales bacterium]|nr:AAA family ATPase [Polyangiales bacterium]
MAVPPTPLSTADDTTPKLIAGRFDVDAVLGKGGVGTVYRVRDRYDRRVLALKRLAVGRGSRSALSASFEREYATLAQLSHPRIIEVYDYGSDAEAMFYTMELLDGSDLSALSPMPYQRACRYLRDVATSLGLLHARRLVHRDVSPRNVHVTREGECKLIDFGALIGFGEPSSVIGTPPCIAPEALESGVLDHRADLYALGCLAYFLLTGRHAYPASHIGQLPSYWAQPITPLSEAKPEFAIDGQPLPAIPKELVELVELLLRADRSARPASSSVVIDRLNVILGDEAEDELSLAESHLASAPIAGRDRELEAAARHLDHLSYGRGSSTLVLGTQGSGKTRVLRQIALRARIRGACVVQLDAGEYEREYRCAQALCRELARVAPEEVNNVMPRHAAALGSLLPELSFDRASLPDVRDDDTLWQSRMQTALRDFVLEVSAQKPLVIVVDNLEHCERASAVFIATLAQETRRHPLCVIAGLDTEHEAACASACDAVRSVSSLHTLQGLPEPALRSWLEALFGEASNLPRLSQALHASTAGHPGRTLETLRAMLHTGEIGFEHGSWDLPLEPAQSVVASASEQSFGLRVTRLTPEARRLAHALALYRGALTPDACRGLCVDANDAVLRGRLDELVARGVLTFNQRVYNFSSAAMRAGLAAEVEPEERARLRKRIGELILSREAPEVSERLQAGVHLLEAGDLRGVRVVATGALEVSIRTQPYAACVEPLERALDLCSAQRRSQVVVALLLSALAVSSYLVDRRLDRHMQRFLTTFTQLLGLTTARKLRPFLGKHLSTFLGLGWGALRYYALPSYLRPASFASLVEAFMAGSAALCGKSVICLDRRSIEDLTRTIEPMTAFGRNHEATYCYDFCRGMILVTQEKLAETHAHWLELEARIMKPGSFPRLGNAGRRLWVGGVHYVLGVFDSFAGDPQALERARKLDESEADVNLLAAAQLRRQYYGFRGETEQVARATEQVEAYALRTGSAWQAETFSAIITNYLASLWHDLSTSKRALDETERIAVEVPSLERYALTSKAVYLLARGKAAECVSVYERVFEQEGLLERIGQSAGMGIMAEALNRCAEHARAKELCEKALAALDPREHVYVHMMLPLHTSLLTAMGALGEHAEAKKRVEALIAAQTKHPSPFVLGALHETAARLAWQRNDRKSFSQHLKYVEEYFCPLGNSALIARYTALTALGGTEGGVSAKIATLREVRAFEAALESLSDRALVAHHVFAWLMQKCDGFSGYLIAQDGNALVPLISSDQREPPPEALEMVKRSLASLVQEAVTTHMPEPQSDTHVERPGRRRDDQANSAANDGLHLHLLSYVADGRFYGEGALVLYGPVNKPPRIRYDFLQVAAKHLQRVRPRASLPAPPPTVALG